MYTAKNRLTLIYTLYSLACINLMVTACGSTKKPTYVEDNILNDTYWLRKDIDGEMMYGGGDNYLRLYFKSNDDYEIVSKKGERITNLKEEGTYVLVDNKELVLTTTKKQQKVSYRYLLANARTFNRVSEEGVVLTNDYDAYKKQ